MPPYMYLVPSSSAYHRVAITSSSGGRFVHAAQSCTREQGVSRSLNSWYEGESRVARVTLTGQYLPA
eukprot:818669-Prymnesium_polylepis.2